MSRASENRSKAERVAQRKADRRPGIIVTVIYSVIALAFFITLAISKMLPVKYMVIVFVLLAFVGGYIFLLVRLRKNKKRFVCGTIFSILVDLGLIYGIYCLIIAIISISNITGTTEETTSVGFYVLVDDPAEGLADIANYTVGVMETQNRTAVDEAIVQTEELIGSSLVLAEYGTATDLIDALYAQDCQAIAMSDAWIDALADTDEYEDIEDNIRLLEYITVVEEVEEKERIRESEEVITLYVSGIDSRTGLISKSRSDVNILIVANTETHQLLMVNTPRDYYVPLSISNGVKDKLTHAGIYGVEVSKDTISMLYDVDIDYYFRVNFSGFEDIVDALGGITVYSEYSFSNGDYTFTKGYNTMDGAMALAFVRERHAFATGDIQRGKNQMAAISAIIDKAISPSILTGYTSLMSSLSGSFETDMSYDVIASLVSDQLDDGSGWNIVSYTVTGTGDRQVPYSMSQSVYVMIPNEETVQTAKDLIEAVYNGEVISDPE